MLSGTDETDEADATGTSKAGVAVPAFFDEGDDALPEAAPRITLEFVLAPEDAARLARAPVLAGLRSGRVRSTPATIIWHDTAAGDLAGAGVSLGCQGPLWSLEALLPGPLVPWLPACAPPLLAGPASLDALAPFLPAQVTREALVPIAAFAGRRRSFALQGETDLMVLEGSLRGVAHDLPVCRVFLTGATTAAVALASALAGQVALRVPRAGLAAEAKALVSGSRASPRRLGAPGVAPGSSVEAAIACVLAHLADVILHWSAQVPEAVTPEPVHQMRVAVRRLRSALSAFRRAAGDDVVDGLLGRLKGLAADLGAARDWDVFMTETGSRVQEAFGEDRRIAALMAAAGRRRATAYATLRTFLGGPAWRSLEMELALLAVRRPWAGKEAAGLLASPVEAYAARVLHRRLKHVLAPGEDFPALRGEALHEVRKRAKRLRYAAEFFAPLFPHKAAKRYLGRLARLQEALGLVNDASVAAGLLADLGGGADRAFACGAMQGFAAARAGADAGGAERAWRKFKREEPFW